MRKSVLLGIAAFSLFAFASLSGNGGCRSDGRSNGEGGSGRGGSGGGSGGSSGSSGGSAAGGAESGGRSGTGGSSAGTGGRAGQTGTGGAGSGGVSGAGGSGGGGTGGSSGSAGGGSSGSGGAGGAAAASGTTSQYANFATMIEIVQVKCTGSGCHNGGTLPTMVGISDAKLYTTLTTYVAQSCGGRVLVKPGSPDQSAFYLVQKGLCGDSLPQMPLGCVDTCTPDDYLEGVREWIVNGAPQQ